MPALMSMKWRWKALVTGKSMFETIIPSCRLGLRSLGKPSIEAQASSVISGTGLVIDKYMVHGTSWDSLMGNVFNLDTLETDLTMYDTMIHLIKSTHSRIDVQLLFSTGHQQGWQQQWKEDQQFLSSISRSVRAVAGSYKIQARAIYIQKFPTDPKANWSGQTR